MQEEKLEVVPYQSRLEGGVRSGGYPPSYRAWAAGLAYRAPRLNVDSGPRRQTNGDIQVSVDTPLQPIAAYGERLQAIGYVHVPHPDDSFCPFFHRPPLWPHSHHIHVVEAGGAEERRTLAFRDYLHDHAAAAREYEDLKRDLAAQIDASNHESREAYARAKTEFIERIVATALRSGYPRAFLQRTEPDKALHPPAARKGSGSG